MHERTPVPYPDYFFASATLANITVHHILDQAEHYAQQRDITALHAVTSAIAQPRSLISDQARTQFHHLKPIPTDGRDEARRLAREHLETIDKRIQNIGIQALDPCDKNLITLQQDEHIRLMSSVLNYLATDAAEKHAADIAADKSLPISQRWIALIALWHAAAYINANQDLPSRADCLSRVNQICRIAVD